MRGLKRPIFLGFGGASIQNFFIKIWAQPIDYQRVVIDYRQVVCE
nr:MAG TPA: hypothetical protein [Bacteriophage sp.]